MAISPTKSRAIQLYEPPQDTVYTIEAMSQLVNVPRRTILVYCKHRLLSPALDFRHMSSSGLPFVSRTSFITNTIETVAKTV